MKVTGRLKDGSPFSYDDIIWVADYEDFVTLYGIDGEQKSDWKRSDIADIKVDFEIPKSSWIPYKGPLRMVSLSLTPSLTPSVYLKSQLESLKQITRQNRRRRIIQRVMTFQRV